jgi:F-type H+-transporting ATPase subunit b
MPAFMNDPYTWLILSFCIFAFVVYKGGKSALLNMLDTRIADIKTEIATAESLRVEAQELLAQYQRKHRDAVKDADTIIANAQKQAEEIRKNTEEDLSQNMARKEKQLRDRLARAETAAIEEIQAYAADLAVRATSEIIASKMDGKTSEKLIDTSISNMNKNIH